MNFRQALEALGEGRKIVHETVTNGENEELVEVLGSVFIKIPRSLGATADNYIFKTPSIEQMLSDGWKEVTD